MLIFVEWHLKIPHEFSVLFDNIKSLQLLSIFILDGKAVYKLPGAQWCLLLAGRREP